MNLYRITYVVRWGSAHGWPIQIFYVRAADEFAAVMILHEQLEAHGELRNDGDWSLDVIAVKEFNSIPERSAHLYAITYRVGKTEQLPFFCTADSEETAEYQLRQSLPRQSRVFLRIEQIEELT